MQCEDDCTEAAEIASNQMDHKSKNFIASCCNSLTYLNRHQRQNMIVAVALNCEFSGNCTPFRIVVTESGFNTAKVRLIACNVNRAQEPSQDIPWHKRQQCIRYALIDGNIALHLDGTVIKVSTAISVIVY